MIRPAVSLGQQKKKHPKMNVFFLPADRKTPHRLPILRTHTRRADMGVGSARDITSSRPGGPISTSTYCRLSFRAPLKWPTWVCQRSSPTHECCVTPFFHHPVPHRKLCTWLSGHAYSSPVPPARFAVVRFACVTSICRCNKRIKISTISWSKSLEPGGDE